MEMGHLMHHIDNNQMISDVPMETLHSNESFCAKKITMKQPMSYETVLYVTEDGLCKGCGNSGNSGRKPGLHRQRYNQSTLPNSSSAYMVVQSSKASDWRGSYHITPFFCHLPYATVGLFSVRGRCGGYIMTVTDITVFTFK
jgi:hypothetical protein